MSILPATGSLGSNQLVVSSLLKSFSPASSGALSADRLVVDHALSSSGLDGAIQGAPGLFLKDLGTTVNLPPSVLQGLPKPGQIVNTKA